MSNLLEIAAGYISFRETVALNPSLFTEAEVESKLNELAASFERGIDQVVEKRMNEKN